MDPDHDGDSDLYVEDICPTCHEHRQRSLNKLTKLAGGLPSSRQLSKRPMGHNISPDISISANLGNQSRSFPHNSSPSYDLNLVDNLSQSWVGLDNRSSFETDSPMTFSPPSPITAKNTTQPEQTPGTPPSEIDADLITTSPTTTTRKERNLAQSHFQKESSSTRIYVSNHSTSHFDTFDNDLFPDLSSSDAQCDWLVPHNDELVISITRATPSKPQSWTGEWNDDIKDVIKNLRRL
jgi:hypothetical protein